MTKKVLNITLDSGKKRLIPGITEIFNIVKISLIIIIKHKIVGTII